MLCTKYVEKNSKSIEIYPTVAKPLKKIDEVEVKHKNLKHLINS